MSIEIIGYMEQLILEMGHLRFEIKDEELRKELYEIQDELIEYKQYIENNFEDVKDYTLAVKVLKGYIERNAKNYPKIEKDISLGDSKLGILAEKARVTVGQVERALMRLVEENDLSKEPLAYMSIMSDYLYTVARVLEFREKIENIIKNEFVIKDKEITSLNLKMAKKYVEFAKEMAKKNNMKVVVAVVNKYGNPIIIEAMDDAFIISFNLARKKAYTAVALKMPTHELAKLTQKDADLEGLENMIDEEIVTLGGGAPIYNNNNIIGAIGISGGTATQDIYLAKCAAQMKEV